MQPDPAVRPDPAASPDPAVRLLGGRRDAIAAEMSRIAVALVAYADGVREPEPRPVLEPVMHYHILDDPVCGCPTCVEWEQRRAEFVEVASVVPKGHKWTVCGCPDCRFVGRIQMNFLAATNRRDLLAEVAYHARYHSSHPTLVMKWLESELRRPEYTINWCAQEMSRYPVERWLKRCEMAVSGVVSGSVWRNSTGVTALETHFVSQLSATATAPSWVE